VMVLKPVAAQIPPRPPVDAAPLIKAPRKGPGGSS
jgi:hypothetical protein